jgi:hypothetical protein
VRTHFTPIDKKRTEVIYSMAYPEVEEKYSVKLNEREGMCVLGGGGERKRKEERVLILKLV